MERTTSFRVDLVSPASPGTEDMRLPDDERQVTLHISALDERGLLDVGYTRQVEIYTHYLGTLSPEPGGEVEPVVATLAAGEAMVTLELPQPYGATFLWVEDVASAGATFATGTSPTLWYRDPFLVDVSTPVDETGLSALEHSPLEQKQVRVAASQHGAAGKLIVTAVYAQGYTVSDVDCSVSPCVAAPYAHMFVFTFGRPRAEDGTPIELGHEVAWVAGGVGEFNGYTELNFPQTELVDETPDLAALPEPVVVQAEWLQSPSGPTGMINLERVESGLIAVDGATVCPLDDEWVTFAQWKLDLGLGCGDPVNVITKGQVTDFLPEAHVGTQLPRVVGTLKSVNIGSFNVWIMLPRQLSDITLP
jgi:hypothetical protein